MSITRPTPIKAILNNGINDAKHVMFNGALKVLESIKRYEDMYNGMLDYPDFCDDAMNKMASLHLRSVRYQQMFIDIYDMSAFSAIKTEPSMHEARNDERIKEFSESGVPYASTKSDRFIVIDGVKCYSYTFKHLSDEALEIWEGLINE